jgi:hypothetical protein
VVGGMRPWENGASLVVAAAVVHGILWASIGIVVLDEGAIRLTRAQSESAPKWFRFWETANAPWSMCSKSLGGPRLLQKGTSRTWGPSSGLFYPRDNLRCLEVDSYSTQAGQEDQRMFQK